MVMGQKEANRTFMPSEVPPKWKIEPKDREASLGDQISIDCQASG